MDVSAVLFLMPVQAFGASHSVTPIQPEDRAFCTASMGSTPCRRLDCLTVMTAEAGILTMQFNASTNIFTFPMPILRFLS